MPVIEILNPQDPIPEVKSVYTALKGVEVEVDLNEDSWARDYFIIFFHTGPNDPVSTSILRYSLRSLHFANVEAHVIACYPEPDDDAQECRCREGDPPLQGEVQHSLLFKVAIRNIYLGGRRLDGHHYLHFRLA